jgi:AcrR family transcriptional regulator
VTPSRPELPKEFVAVRKRRRITDALAELSAEKGYEATKIADIVRRAGVARKTLYDNFEGKEEVLLAALDLAVEEMVGAVEAGCESAAGDWRARLEAGVAALLSYVAENPAAARLCLVESLSATPAASARYDEATRRFIALLERATPKESGLPATLAETLVGGVAWILNQRIRRGEARSAEGLRVELSEFILSPYYGVAESGFEPGGESNSTVADLSG